MNFNDEPKRVTVNARSVISFGTLCWFAWLVFLILKCVNVLPESFTWFWVWFPFWLPFALSGAFFVIAIIACVLYTLISGKD